MDALVNKAPLALRHAARVSSREIAMVASGHSTEAERIALAVDQGVLAAPSTPSPRLQDRLRGNSDPSCARRSTAPLAQLSGTAGRSRSSSRARCTAAPTAPAARLFGQDAIAGAAALQTQLAPALDRLLAARVDHLRATAPRPTSRRASASRSPPTSSWPSSSP
jgi:hypothetical protein